MEYIYLIQEREFIKTKENIYKIGKTKQENLKRFNSYPNGSNLLIQIICCNCNKIEKELIKLFREKYELQIDIGNEYFKGDYIEMIKDINNTIFNYKEDEILVENNEKNNDIIKQFLSEYIDIHNSHFTISKIYMNFRIWAINNVSKDNNLPDRNQIKSYLENNRNPYLN